MVMMMMRWMRDEMVARENILIKSDTFVNVNDIIKIDSQWEIESKELNVKSMAHK